MKALRNSLSMMIVMSLLVSGVVMPAQAAMIQTQEIASHQTVQLDKARIAQFLSQAEVQDQLSRQGVTPEEMSARIDALTPAEAATLAQRIDALPAGGASVLGVVFLVFVILLITDIMGYTQIFPFVVNTGK